ncbi:MAG: hypothetical protein ACYTE3_18915, partial [Planctomycetota bacterium]
KWASFGDDWFSGMLASQDPIAIDSVGLDFLRHEDALSQPITDVTGNPDNYLHEAAQADSPPSGTAYDPEGDGTRLTSLGVHEHWNNPVDRQYSRNLGTGDGIELVIASFATEDGPIENATTGLKYDQLRYAIGEARSGDTIILSEGSYPGDIDFAGKNLTFTSIDPDDPAVVAATIIGGGGRQGGYILRRPGRHLRARGLYHHRGRYRHLLLGLIAHNCRLSDRGQRRRRD